MFGLRKTRFDVAEAERRDEAVRRVEEVTEELSRNADALKTLVARLREENSEEEKPR